MKMKMALFTVVLVLASSLAMAEEGGRKGCEELKGEIAAKLDAKGVKNYTLNIVKSDEVKEAKVVGSCDAGAMKITYERK